MPLHLLLNGDDREFPLPESTSLAEVILHLGFKGDRVAVEHNGTIVARSGWESTPLVSGDRLEVVHFVGGGSPVS